METVDHAPPLERVTIYSADNERGVAAVIGDLVWGARAHEIWRAFAWDEIQHRYYRSAVGIAWIGLSYVAFVVGIGFFFNGLAALQASSFFIYVAFGFAAFTFLAGNLTDGVAVFTSSASWIKSARLPYSIYVFKSISRSLFTFALQFVSAIALVAIFFGWRPAPTVFWILPVLVLYTINAFWIQYALGLFSARWGDVQHLISTLQRFLFFMTPILWVYDERGPALKFVADMNPFTHLIEIFRAPMMGEYPDILSVCVSVSVTVLGCLGTLLLAARARQRLPFWV